MKRCLINFLGIFIIAGCLFPLSADEGWELAKDSEGIKVYTRDVEGGSFEEYRAVTIINAPMEVIGEVLKDVPAEPEWMYRCEQARFVKKFDDSNFIFYNIWDFPFPADTRDAVLEARTVLDYKNGKCISKFWSVEDPSMPINKKYVRMTIKGKWDFKRISPEMTLFIYENNINPGGTLPAFIVNIFGLRIPFDTVKGMREMVKKEKYIKAAKEKYGIEFGEN